MTNAVLNLAQMLKPVEENKAGAPSGGDPPEGNNHNSFKQILSDLSGNESSNKNNSPVDLQKVLKQPARVLKKQLAELDTEQLEFLQRYLTNVLSGIDQGINTGISESTKEGLLKLKHITDELLLQRQKTQRPASNEKTVEAGEARKSADHGPDKVDDNGNKGRYSSESSQSDAAETTSQTNTTETDSKTNNTEIDSKTNSKETDKAAVDIQQAEQGDKKEAAAEAGNKISDLKSMNEKKTGNEGIKKTVEQSNSKDGPISPETPEKAIDKNTGEKQKVETNISGRDLSNDREDSPVQKSQTTTKAEAEIDSNKEGIANDYRHGEEALKQKITNENRLTNTIDDNEHSFIEKMENRDYEQNRMNREVIKFGDSGIEQDKASKHLMSQEKVPQGNSNSEEPFLDFNRLIRGLQNLESDFTGDAGDTGSFLNDGEGDSLKQNGQKGSSEADLFVQPGLFENVQDDQGRIVKTGNGEFRADLRGTLEQLNKIVKGRVDNSSKQIKIQLEPEILGKINVDLKVKDGQVMARVIVENGGVKEYLEQNLTALKNNFDQQGLNLDQFEIQTRSPSRFGGNTGQDMGSSQGQFGQQQGEQQDNSDQVYYNPDYYQNLPGQEMMGRKGYEIPQSLQNYGEQQRIIYSGYYHRMNLLA